MSTLTSVDVDGGTIDGAVIGASNPANATFANLQSGQDGSDGQITIYSEQGATDYSIIFQPNASMTQSTTYILPLDDGSVNEVLTTNGSGELVWQNVSVVGGNTLDQAYDEGGVGVGRTLTVDSGAVRFFGSNASDETLEITNSGNGGALLIENTGSGLSLRVNDEASDASPFIIDAAGNVGIGVLTPTVSLHVAGQCVTADSRLRRRRKKKAGEKADPEKDEWEDEEYIYDEVMIKDIRPGDEIASMDPITGELVYSQVRGLMNMGIKPLYRLTTQSGRQIRTTENHPYFVRTKYEEDKVVRQNQKLYRFEVDQSIKIEQYSQDTVVAIANDENSTAIVVPKKVKQTLRALGQKHNASRLERVVVFASAVVTAIKKMNAEVRELTIDTEYTGYDDVIAKIIGNVFPDIYINFEQVGKKSPAHVVAYGAHKKQKSVDYVATLDDLEHIAENALSAGAHPHIRRTIHRTWTHLISSSIDDNKNVVKGGKNGRKGWFHSSRRNGTVEPECGMSADGLHSSAETMEPTGIDDNKKLVKSGQWVKVKGLKVKQMIAVTHGDKVVWEKITKIEQLPAEKVYDIEVQGTHNFIANGIVAHNTYLGGTTTINDGDLDMNNTATNHLLLPLNNDAATPTLAFGDGDSGFYESSNNAIVIAIGASPEWQITSWHLRGMDASGPSLRNENTSNINPTLLPDNGDTNTGVGSAADDQLSLIAGGIEGIRINTAATGVNYLDITPSATTNAVQIASAGTDTNIDLALMPKGTGNVGIGTDTPDNPLDVYINQSNKYAAKIFNDESGSAHGLLVQSDGTGGGTYVLRAKGGATAEGFTVFGDGAMGFSVGGSPNRPAIASQTVAYFDRTSSGKAYISILGKSIYETRLQFGDQNDENVGYIEYNHPDDSMRLIVNTNEALRIKSTGYVGIGTTSPNSKLDQAQFSADAVGSYHTFSKSRNATAGSHTVVSDNDIIGGLNFAPSDGTDFGTVSARILAEVDDASPAASSIGGALTFSTAAGAGADDLAEAMRIDKDGNVGIGTNSPLAKLDVDGEIYINDKIRHRTDTNTYINFLGNDQIRFVLGGSSMFRIEEAAQDSIYSIGSNDIDVIFGPDASRFFVEGSTGNVGIGATSPNSKLDQAQFSADAVGSYHTFSKSRNATAGSHTVVSDNDIIGGLNFAPSDGTDFGTVSARILAEVDDASPAASSIGGALTFSTAAGAGADDLAEAMRIDKDGNVGIGTNAPGYLLDLYGGRLRIDDWTADGDTVVYKDDGTGAVGIQASDIRLKKNITNLESSLEKALSLQGFLYNTLDEEDGSKKRLGLSAQDVREVFPEATFAFTNKETDEEYYGIHYEKISVILVEAIKEQQEQINALTLAVGESVEGYLQTQSANGNLFLDDVSFEAHVAFNKDTVGTAKILAGDNTVRVDFVQAYERVPIVTLTLASDIDLKHYLVLDTDINGFTIKISPIYNNQDIEINWHAFGVNYEEEEEEEEEETVNKTTEETVVDETADDVVDETVDETVDKTVVDETGDIEPTIES